MSEFRSDGRSASEVLGYIFVFALVLMAIAFVTALGVPTLEDVRDSEQSANAERAFDVVADNMAAIYERNSPSRSTEIDLANTELFYGNNISIAVTVDDGSVVRTHEYQIRPVVLRVNDKSSLVYEGGAVFRVEQNGGLVLRDPPFLFTETRVHAPIIQTTAPGIETASGTTVLLRGQATDRSIVATDTEGGFQEVTVEISSPRYELWAEYLTEQDALDCTTDDSTETVECDLDDPEIVYVTRHRIDVSIIL